MLLGKGTYNLLQIFLLFFIAALFLIYGTVVGNARVNKAEAALPRAFPHGRSSDDYDIFPK